MTSPVKFHRAWNAMLVAPSAETPENRSKWIALPASSSWWTCTWWATFGDVSSSRYGVSIRERVR